MHAQIWICDSQIKECDSAGCSILHAIEEMELGNFPKWLIINIHLYKTKSQATDPNIGHGWELP